MACSTCRGSSALPPLSLPAAAQERGGAGRRAQYRQSAPRCAAGLAPAARTRQTTGPAASPRAPARCHCRRGRSAACRAPGGGIFRNSAVCFTSYPLPALAVFCPRGAAWCVDSARAIATLRRSCRSHCLSRRCRLRMAAPACSPLNCDHMKAQQKIASTNREQPA